MHALKRLAKLKRLVDGKANFLGIHWLSNEFKHFPMAGFVMLIGVLPYMKRNY